MLEEQYEKQEDNFKLSKGDIIMFIAILLVCSVILIIVLIDTNNSNLEKSSTSEEVVVEEGDLQINSGELKTYMIDRLNGIYLKVAQTKLRR